MRRFGLCLLLLSCCGADVAAAPDTRPVVWGPTGPRIHPRTPLLLHLHLQPEPQRTLLPRTKSLEDELRLRTHPSLQRVRPGVVQIRLSAEQAEALFGVELRHWEGEEGFAPDREPTLPPDVRAVFGLQWAPYRRASPETEALRGTPSDRQSVA